MGNARTHSLQGLILGTYGGVAVSKITALIVDDEQPARDELAYLLKNFPRWNWWGKEERPWKPSAWCAN